MHKALTFVFLILSVVCFSSVHAEVHSREFELMSGYGIGHLAVEVEDCAIIPVIGRVLWELKPGGYFGAD